jgi:hypothetical protein
MNRKTFIGLTIGIAALSASTLAGCSSSSSTTESAAPSAVGGMTECTEAIVGTAASEAAAALAAGNVFTLENLACSNGWAVASGTLGDGSTASDAPQGAPTSFIFQAEGQFWVPQDKAAVCGSDPAATAAPADATIPADLYAAGCAAG